MIVENGDLPSGILRRVVNNTRKMFFGLSYTFKERNSAA